MASTPAPEFVTATAADVALVRDIVRAAYKRWVPVVGREPLPMKADYDKAVMEHHIELLTVDGLVVGVIETMLKDDHLWIENIAVSPVEQGKGYGRMLLARAEHLARVAGRSEVQLLTNAAFETNVALYRRTGYAITLTEPFMGGTTVYMAKPVEG
ncbi:GNAT family N-acetyltransferase [Rhizobiaceae bacterium BDR2-2]|uniref:GNAT family N-acetyltransferase n=1 Tax=Ectorhizobium quercum TaxID=2965071 RepID=A0AAE3SU62_9HYPH|nr:GNAT family N-acetyltransferase [Ectorhizobium quercum]MCX8996727.1 GNAT family N-acetyltransferase [Ectorhizobium quercum]